MTTLRGHRQESELLTDQELLEPFSTSSCFCWTQEEVKLSFCLAFLPFSFTMQLLPPPGLSSVSLEAELGPCFRAEPGWHFLLPASSCSSCCSCSSSSSGWC